MQLAEHSFDGSGPRDEGDPIPPKRKNVAVPLVLAFLGLGLGLSHLYVRKRTAGLVLLAVAAVGIGLAIGGNVWGMLIVGGVWLFDLIGGIAGVYTYNAALDALVHQVEPEAPDDVVHEEIVERVLH